VSASTVLILLAVLLLAAVWLVSIQGQQGKIPPRAEEAVLAAVNVALVVAAGLICAGLVAGLLG
jgi:hypothetical protein